MKVDENTEIVKAVVKNLTTNEEQELEEKNNRTHMFKPFNHNGITIQLRLDWNNNFAVEPILDVDLYTSTSRGKKNKIKKQKIKFHNINRLHDKENDIYYYPFKFEDLEIKFSVRKTYTKTIKGNASIADSLKINHNGKEVFNSDGKFCKSNNR